MLCYFYLYLVYVKKYFKLYIQCVSKKLKVGTYNRLGTNFSGKICVFHRGGGNKHFYRVIDFIED